MRQREELPRFPISALPKGKWIECITTCTICRRYVRCASPPMRRKPWSYTDEYYRPVAICCRCTEAAALVLQKPSSFGHRPETLELSTKGVLDATKTSSAGRLPPSSSGRRASRPSRSPRRSP